MELSADGARDRLKTELDPMLDERVLNHLPPSLQRPEGERAVERWMEAVEADSLVHSVRQRKGSELLGLLILAPFRETDNVRTIHLGYLFTIEAWGKGYATELINGLVDWCAGQPGSWRLVGGVERDNPASAAVLRKAGFERSADLSTDETDTFVKIVGNSRTKS